jgi:hypothetical protein
MPSPSEIASTGQLAAHAPQGMQASVILYAIWINLPCTLDYYGKMLCVSKHLAIPHCNIKFQEINRNL